MTYIQVTITGDFSLLEKSPPIFTLLPTCRTRLRRDMAPPAIFSSFHQRPGKGQEGTRLHFYKLEDDDSSALCAH